MIKVRISGYYIAPLYNLSTKNRLRDCFLGSKSRQITREVTRQVFKLDRVFFDNLSSSKDSHKFCFIPLNSVLLSCLELSPVKTLSSNLSRF